MYGWQLQAINKGVLVSVLTSNIFLQFQKLLTQISLRFSVTNTLQRTVFKPQGASYVLIFSDCFSKLLDSFAFVFFVAFRSLLANKTTNNELVFVFCEHVWASDRFHSLKYTLGTHFNHLICDSHLFDLRKQLSSQFSARVLQCSIYFRGNLQRVATGHLIFYSGANFEIKEIFYRS